MSTIARQAATSFQLAAKDAPMALPGLNFNTVVQAMIEAQYKPIFDEIRSKTADAEAAEQEIKDTKIRLKAYFNTDAAKIEINAKIDAVKISAKSFIDGVKEMPTEISIMIGNLIVPPTTPTPTAPGVPNPLHTIAQGKEKVAGLKTILNAIASWFIMLLKAANAISYVLPAPLLTMGDQIATLKGLIGTIPV